MTLASALSSSLLRRSFASDASSSSSGDTSQQQKAPHGWGQTRVAELLESKGSDRGAWLWCSKDDFVIEAVRKMTQGNVGSLLVFDPAKARAAGSGGAMAPGDAVVGIVTERDYLTKVVVQGKQSSSLHVREIMTARSKLLTVPPQSSVVDVMGLMVENNIRHVPVVEGGSFLGMVSIRDVVTTMLEEHREEVGRLHEYISGSY